MEENFDQALLRFRAFLKNNGFPALVVWLMPPDVLLTGSEVIYVRYPDLDVAQMAARSVFEQGSTRGNGVLLKGMFSDDRATYCYIWVPSDRTEAANALLSPIVKLAVVTPQFFRVNVVQSDEEWLLLTNQYRGEQSLRMQLFS